MGIQIQANAVREPEPRDLFPPAVLRDLALVIEQTVNRAGGVEAVAALLGANKGRVSEWSNPDHPHWPNLRQIINVERFAKVDWITQAMAALHGADLVKRGSVHIEGELLDRIAMAARECGESTAVAALAIGVGGSAKTIRDAIKETDDAIRARMALKSSLEALLAGEVR